MGLNVEIVRVGWIPARETDIQKRKVGIKPSKYLAIS
jgi:hypothetical protein